MKTIGASFLAVWAVGYAAHNWWGMSLDSTLNLCFWLFWLFAVFFHFFLAAR